MLLAVKTRNVTFGSIAVPRREWRQMLGPTITHDLWWFTFHRPCKFFCRSISPCSVAAVLFNDTPRTRDRDAVPASKREQFVGLAFVLDLSVFHFRETR